MPAPRAIGTCSRRSSGCRPLSFWPSPSSPPSDRMSAMTATSVQELLDRLEPTARLDGERFQVTDRVRLRDEKVDDLVFDAVFNPDAALRDAARWLIWAASQDLGCPSASIHELYMARG